MQVPSSQYVQSVSFNALLPDECSWEKRMIEYGLEREAFSIARAHSGACAVITFWEPDRGEAMRIMNRLDSFRVS